MEIEVHTSYDETVLLVEAVQQAADNNRRSLGFLQKSVYKEYAARNRLWVATTLDGEYVGHLIFGGHYPTCRVFQLLISPKHRRKGFAKKLVSMLVAHAEKDHYLSIIARVASDLKANVAWDKLGFRLAQQQPGGETSNRIINVRVLELNTPSLFPYSDQDFVDAHDIFRTIKYSDRPTLETPAFGIDVNVLLDVTKNRRNAAVARSVLTVGLADSVNVCVSAEFVRELKKHNIEGTDDIALQLAQGLPRLPAVDDQCAAPLAEELRHIVFPTRKLESDLTENDRADLRHILSAIHHRLSGFVTSEIALLKASQVLSDTYNIEIISPSDFVSTFNHSDVRHTDISVSGRDRQFLNSRQATEVHREAVERFLLLNGMAEQLLPSVWAPGSHNALRKRIIISDGEEKIVGVASWTIPSRFSKTTKLYVFVDESRSMAVQTIDHILEAVQLNAERDTFLRLDLVVSSHQTLTKKTAIDRGFRQIFETAGSQSERLSKVMYRGVITGNNWANIRTNLRELSGMILPERFPDVEEIENTGLVIHSNNTTHKSTIRLFDFETLLSPAFVLCKGRQAIIVPIRRHYAEELFAGYRKQLGLLPDSEARLHIEKAYFRSPSRSGTFRKGLPVLFYVSGKSSGDRGIVGFGRITYSAKLTVDEVRVRLARQGVLSQKALMETARNGMLHAFTFDNFDLFPKIIDFSDLKSESIISDANLVAPEGIDYGRLRKILRLGEMLGAE